MGAAHDALRDDPELGPLVEEHGDLMKLKLPSKASKTNLTSRCKPPYYLEPSYSRQPSLLSLVVRGVQIQAY